MIFVELCAGTAAVSLAWLCAGAKSILSYQGSKRAFVDAILSAFGMASGGTHSGDRVLLVEPGPWGRAWQLLRLPSKRARFVERLRAWSAEDPHELWNRLREAPVPVEDEEFIVTWMVLQYWGYGRKPVYSIDGVWKTHGFNKAEAYRSTYRVGEKYFSCGVWKNYSARDHRLPILIESILSLPDLSCVDVIVGDARSVVPIPGATVYIDPDYAGTTGYGYSLPRPDLLRLAERWRAAGCIVAMSEAEPLPLDWPCFVRLPPPRGRGRNNFSKQKEEWLTISHCTLDRKSA